ncbi:MAG: DUF2341 domain-containing protein [Ekhidna sp.]
MRIIRFLLLLAFTGILSSLSAQTGPGGVDTRDGTGELVMWFIADSATVNGSSEVTAWQNEVSIAGNGLVELGTGVRPIWVSSAINGHAEISFGDQIDALISSAANLNSATFPTNEATTFVVTRHDNASQQSSVYTTGTAANGGIGTNRFTSHLPWNNIAYYDLGNCCGTGDSRIQITYDAGWVGNYGVFTYQRDLVDGMEVWRDNASVAGPSGTPASSYTSHGSQRFYIGHSSSDNFQGDIAEILVFKDAINDAERTIVNNYIAAKYNLNITDDFYLFQTSHGVDVIGIGQDGTDTKLEAKSANIITIKDASSIDTDGDFVFAGHDNGDAAAWTTSEQINGDTNLERIAREWRFDASGDPGTITISIDPTDLPAFNTDFDFYTLWIDDDGDFTSGAVQYPLTQNGAEFEASGITVTDGMYVTIAAYRPEINFTQTSFGGLETTTPATFEVNVDYAVDANITVDYTVLGTCTEDLPAAGTFTISTGNTTTTLVQAITSGDGFEADETIILTLTGGSQSAGVLGSSAVSTYTVNDDGASATNTIQYDAPFSYGFVKRLTIDKDMISGSSDLTDFPLMVRIDGADLTEIEGDGIRGDAFDIRFTYANSVEWLEHQIEVYDAGNEYIAWVKIPALSASSDTEIDIYYGNALATTDPSVSTVFSGPSYEGVWHLGDATDGSSNNHSGTVNGGATHAAGFIGDALSLDGSNDDLSVSNISSLVFAPTDNMTMSLWYRGTDTAGDFMSMMNQADGAQGYSIRYFGGDLSYLLGEDYLSASRVGLRANATENVNDDAWHYIVVTYDGSVDAGGITIYKDGDATAFGSIVDNTLLSGSDTDPGTDFSIGSRTNGAGKTQFLSGLVDEARIARSTLTSDWIKTEYNNMTDAGVLITTVASVATTGFNIAESTDQINLTIALTSVDLTNDVSVDYAVTSGSATNGADYTLASGTATITSGNLSTVVAVDLTDDALDEADENFTVSLSNPSSISNVSLGANNEIEITLLDDDSGPTITASDTLLYVNEGSTINSWSVDLNTSSGQPIMVDYAVTAISATSGLDYILSSGTLTIPSDSISVDVNFNIIDDETIESGETFAIKLSNPINGILDLAYDSITVVINDNDNFGIDGPGGIGDADGSGTLVMWMIADSANVSGSDIVSWENEVGISELDLTPPLTAPTLVSNARNGHAEISFANVNDVLSTSSRLSTAYFPYNEASTFIVTRHDNLTQQSNTYGTSTSLGGGLATNRFSAHMPWNGTVYYDIGNCCGTDGRSQFTYDTDWVGEYTIFSYTASSSDGKTVRGNATQQDFDAGTDIFQNHSDYYFNLGQTQSSNFQGDILEYIMFTSPLNSAQVIIMENYLAAKYNLTLDQNDYYAFKTTHSFELVGIGQEDATNFHNAAQSSLLTISNASDLDDVEYVMVGHDNLDVSAWTTTDVPSDLSNIQRVEREFRVDVTGSPGTITIAIDSDQLPTLPTDYTEYVLLTDADGVFSSGATVYSMTLVDGEFIANNVSVSQGTYFTIGTHRRTIEFVGNAIQDFENTNNTISLSLSLASGTDVSIPYTITGSATNGADYTLAASGSFTISAGNTVEIIDLGILNEAVEESDETIIVTLGAAPSGTVLGSNAVFTYTINDDDIVRSINFDHFKYFKQVTINGSQVTGAHADFPVMISFTDNDLRTTGNAGFVENDNGYDIAFYDSLNGAWLDHQLEYYDASTGEAVIWIRIPALAAATDVDLTMFYGNSGITFDQSSSDTWKSSYQGVWHMGEDNYDDGTANGSNGVDQGADDADGIIGRGASFDGISSVKVTDVSNLSFGVSDSYTISAWYKGTDAAKTIAGLVDDNSNGQGYDLYISSSNYLIGWQGDDSGAKNYIRGSAGGAINDDTWTYVVVTYNGTSGIAYRNGANAMGSQNATLTGTLSPNVAFTIGSRSSGAAIARAIIGTIDEVRVLNEVLSPEWIATEYENQSNPGTFVTINPTQNANDELTLAEDINEVTVSVRVDPVDDAQATTVDFGDAASGTAIISEDFMLTPATVTIPAGEQLGSFTFNVVNDLTDEQDETAVLNINTPSSNTKLGTVSEQTYTITDDDNGPEIGFVDTLSVANEGTSVVAITLKLGIESGNDVSVDYAVTAGDAIAGTDYIALGGTATVPAGSLTTTISFQPIDDAIIESPETVELTISNPINGTLETDFDVHTLTIADNDDLGFEGPGGVGDVENALGENLLKLWLIADSVNFSGGSVTSWNNLIQNVSIDYDMVPVGTAPDVVDAAVNGHKEISFNNVSDALVSQGTLSAASFPGNEMSFFIVAETDNLIQDSYAYATDNSENGAVDANSVSASIPNGSGNVEFDLDGDNFSTTYQTGWAGSHSIFTHIVSSDTFLVYRNNGVLVNRDDANPSFTGHTAYNFYLGKNGAADNFQGDIAEVIMFSRDVNVAQSNIINNYLAAKYNLTITNDFYNFEVSHGVEVAGIGQVDANNQHVAARAGIVTISNADDLDDGEYVLFGHDNGDVSSWTTAEIPAAGIQRTAREWRFDNTGAPGTISIAISSDLLPALPNGDEDYIIIQDTDGDFTSGATVINTVLVDGQYKASNLSIASGDYVTFGIATRNISFDPITLSGSETVAANATILLSLESSSNITLDYEITDGTATGSNDDYSLATTGQVTFIAGQTSVSLPLGIINDSDIESDETIEITLSNPPAGVTLSDSVFTYTINDDDNGRNVQFNAASSSGAESVTSISLQVDLNLVDATNDTKVYYSITDGTAEASPSPDYVFTADTLTIAATQTSGTIDFTILDDVLSEATETIVVSLSSPINANLGTNTMHTYSITDNDGLVTVEFQDATTSIDEGGSIAEVIVELSGTSGQDVLVDYTVGEVTATGSGVDFALANSTLTIPAGSQLGSINVALTDDGIEESAETFTITLSGEVGATLGSEDTHTVTISDNDAEFGYYGPGGVGDAESNMVWLDATAVNGKGVANLSDGSNVTTWVDRSGNGFDFIAIGSAPTFDEDALNLKNTVIISSTNQGFQAPSGFSNALSNYSFISVMSQSSGNYLVETNTAARSEFRLSQGANGLYSINDTDYLPSQSTNTDITTWRFNSESGTSAEVFRNGAALLSDNNYQVMAIDNNFALGSRNADQAQATSDFAGNISEFIMYRNVINDAQRVIIENYLANKYDLTIPNDYYSFEGTYGNDIVGIGQTNNEQHLQSMSDSLMMISGASDLQNDEFVFAGHDGGDDLTWTTSEAPGGGSNVRRLAREWRVDLTGAPGTIIIKIDTTQLPTPPSGYDQYVVYTDEDGDFRSGATTYQVDYSAVFGFHVTDEVVVSDGTFITIGVGQPVIQFSLTENDGDENVTNPSIEVGLNFTLGEDATVNYAATGGSATGGNVDYLLASGTLTITAGQSAANISLGVIDDTDVESDETIEITLTTPSDNVALGSNTVFTYTIHDDDNPEGRTIDFATAGPGAGDEATPSVTSVFVNLNTPDDDVATTVDLQVISSGANAADETDDFVLSTSTVTFPADNTTVAQSFDITVVDDAIFEGTEVITIQLTNPVNADLGTVTEYTLNITDDDAQPVAGFTQASSFINESAGIAAMEVSLDAVSVNDVTINYTVTSTATSGADYTLSNGSVLILAGSMSEDIQAVIVDDLVTEAAENVTVTLTTGTNATVGGTTVHVLTILDNDQAGSTGPGGVGDASSNLLWLVGDNFTPGTWTDVSGNSNNFTGAGPAAGGTGINSQSTVEFNGAQSLTLATAISSTASDYDVFFVTDADVATDQILFDDADGIFFGVENSNGGFQDSDATWKGDEIATGTGSPSIIQYNLESGSGLAAISLNGTEDTPTVPFDYTATSIGGASTLGSLTGGGSGFDGEMGEVLVYNSPLNDAQNIIVNNYLSTRYNITIPNDNFAFDDGTATNDYFYNLIGIGRTDANNIHVSATTQDFLTISNPNNLGDSEYMMIANDGADMSSWTFTGAPANGSTRKVAREWRVDNTGDVGTITFQVDTTALPAPPSDGFTWALIVTSDGDFTDIDSTYPLTSVSGDIVGVDGLSFADGDYFSLALIEYQSTGVSSNFSDPLAWTTGVVPTAGTNARIVDGHSLFLSADAVVGSLTLEGTGALNLAGFTLDFSGDCIVLNGSGSVDVSTPGSTIGYVNPNVTEQCVTGMIYNNLYTDGPSGSTKYLTGNITVQGDMNLQSSGGAGAVFDTRESGTANDYDIEIEGDWISEITFLARTGSVTFDGTAQQTINTSGGETFNNLTINKLGAVNMADSTVSLGSGIATNGILTMTRGFVDLNAFDVTINNGSSIVGGDADAYFIVDGVGVLRHAITALSTAYEFPIGDSDEYAPFTFTLNSGTLSSSSVTINMRDAKHTNITEDNFITRYWTLDNENITGSLDYDVSYIYENVDVVGVEGSLMARKFSGAGDDIGGTVDVALNTISNVGYDSFSDFTAESEPVPLPVTLLYFIGEVTDSGVLLKWETASEINNSHFEVLRSLDGETFRTVGIINGNGNSSTAIEYSMMDTKAALGLNYYKLKQVDFDNTEYMYETILVDNNDGTTMSAYVYPNPAREENFNVRIISVDRHTPVSIKIVDLRGNVYYSKTIEDGSNFDNKILPEQSMVEGIYFMIVTQGDQVQKSKVVIKK